MSARSAIAALGLAVAATALTACAGDDGAGGDTTTAPASTSTTALPTTSAPTPTTTAAPTTEPATTAPPSDAPTTTIAPAPVFAFPSAASIEGWNVINDTVMGGVSSGELAWADGALVFTGDLSLDNNGGFASMRSPAIDPAVAADWASRTGPVIHTEGDGRSWTLEVRTDDGDGGWIATLPTSESVPLDTELPWSSFEPVTRFLAPRDVSAPLDPARIVSIAFYLVDGIEGPFRFELGSVS